jgi:spore protease
MNFRTDLALECREPLRTLPGGILCEETWQGGVKVSRVEVVSPQGAKALGKPEGKYITLEFTAPSGDTADTGALLADEGSAILAAQLRPLLPQEGLILCVGLGNDGITPDSLGPRTLAHVFATRHIQDGQPQNTDTADLRAVACLTPGVLGRTGIESAEMLTAVVRALHPAAVIVVDALASRKLSRLGRTVQIATTGIVPGSGVGNARRQINEATLGVPVVSAGIPTVVDATTLAADLMEGITAPPGRQFALPPGDMMVTPREIDLLIDRGAKLLALGLNCALQPSLSAEDFAALFA